MIKWWAGQRSPAIAQTSALLKQVAQVADTPQELLDAIHYSQSAKSFAKFARFAWPHIEPAKFISNWHIDCVARHLQALVEGDLSNRKLMINVPPGSSKSTIVSVMWPAWCWGPGGRPDLRFMATAYRGDLAIRDSHRCRMLIRSEWYQRLWGGKFSILKDRDAITRFDNDRTGYRIALPTSGIMGEGADFVLMDDPLSVMQAESDDVRDDIVRKIRMALPSRVRDWERGGAVCIAQRVHWKDYTGVCLEQEDDWDHLCFPARYEPDHPTLTKSSLGFVDPRTTLGEVLCPIRFSEERLRKLEVEMGGEYASSGQYQQRPTPREGGMFKRRNFHFIDADEVPAAGIVVRGYDLASTKESTATAETASCKMRLHKGTIYVEHSEAYKAGPFEVEQNVIKRAEADGKKVPISLPQDPGQAGVYQVNQYAKRLHGYQVHISPEEGNKEARARPLVGQTEAGTVMIVRGGWNDEFIDDCCGFPMSGKDRVDAATRAYKYLVEEGGPKISFGTARGQF